MARLNIARTPPRVPNRKKSSATLSVPWHVYDKLDKLAKTNSCSIGKVIAAMLEDQGG